jgi:hypothetical protein
VVSVPSVVGSPVFSSHAGCNKTCNRKLDVARMGERWKFVSAAVAAGCESTIWAPMQQMQQKRNIARRKRSHDGDLRGGGAGVVAQPSGVRPRGRDLEPSLQSQGLLIRQEDGLGHLDDFRGLSGPRLSVGGDDAPAGAILGVDGGVVNDDSLGAAGFAKAAGDIGIRQVRVRADKVQGSIGYLAKVVEFIGHPLLDCVVEKQGAFDFMEPGGTTILGGQLVGRDFLPGSRGCHLARKVAGAKGVVSMNGWTGRGGLAAGR